MEQMNIPNMIPSRALTDYLYNKAGKLRIPLSGTFELSPVCNFSCKMCYVRKTQKEVDESPRKILTLADWQRIAREARDAGMLYLLLTGGEPLLWPDFWTLYEELIDMGFLVSINTNGSLIDEAAVARFRRRPPQKINITLYGAGHDGYRNLCGNAAAYDRVDKAIRSLQEAGIAVKINSSLTPENAADRDGIVDYALRCGAPLTMTTYMFPPVRRDPTMTGRNQRFTPEEAAENLLAYLRRERGEEAYEGYLRSILRGCTEPPGLDEGCIDPVDGRIRCRAGSASFWITWDGWMTPCGMMPEPKVDLREHDFPDAWKLLADTTSALRLSGVCKDCPNVRICHPCAAVAYAETGSVSGIPVYRCKMTREMYRIANETLRNADNTVNNYRGGKEI